MKYAIIASGSNGNAVLFNDYVLVDCGVSFSKLATYLRGIKIVLLTHIHGDHFNPSTIKRLAAERPTLRFVCGAHLIAPLLTAGVELRNIDIVEPDICYLYTGMTVTAFELHHDVPNFGYKIVFENRDNPRFESVVYATDTKDLPEIPNYDFYFVESNYKNLDKLAERIREKREKGEYIYEERVAETHMSEEYVTDWLQRNGDANSQYVFLHAHKED